MDRRRLVMIGVVTLLLPSGASRAWSNTLVDQAELLKPGPLPEQIFGDANAPITVVEYASLTCHHCENFHKTVWPDLKKKYVDTGKVRFIIREFPLDPLAMGGFMLARCSTNWYAVVDLLYQTADSWAHSKTPVEVLAQTMRQTGMNRDAFESCLRNQKLMDNLEQVRQRGAQAFNITSTPTFFINGRRQAGAFTLAEFDSIVEPILAGRTK